MRARRGHASSWFPICLVVAALLAAPAVPVLEAAAAAETRGAAVAAPDSAVLEIYNRHIFVMRSAIGAVSPQERAAMAAHRIESYMKAHAAGKVTTRSIPQGILLEIDQRGAFIVMPTDVDSLGGETLPDAAQAAAERLQAALDAAADQRRPERILRAILLSLAGTAVFVLGVRLLMTLHRRLRRKVQAVQVTARSSSKLRGLEFFDVPQLERWAGRGLGALIWVLGFVLFDLWLTWVLGRFPYTAPWADALGGWFVGTLQQLGLGIVRAIPGILTVVLIFIVTRVLVRALAAFFGAVQLHRISVPWLHADVAQPTHRIAATLLWLFAIMVAYPYVPGSGSGVFKGVSLFVGVVLSLGSSAVVQQVMAGFVLMYSRALRRGEYLQVGEVEGTIRDLGMLYTKLETPTRELVAIPNAVMIGAQIKNFSRLAEEGHPVTVQTSVTIGYDAPWRQVHAMLEEAAVRTDGILREPGPRVVQRALSDFYVEYMLVVPIGEPNRRNVIRSELHKHIQDVFNENGVQIMSPHFEGQPEGKVWSAPADWNPPLARRQGQSPPS